MRNLFALVFVLSLVSGCYLSHERPLPVTVMEDSGPILGDAGTDAGPTPVGECAVGETRHCYSGPATTEGVGRCHGSDHTCVLDPDGVPAWDEYPPDCVGEVTPYPWGDILIGDGIGVDDDCDGETDESDFFFCGDLGPSYPPDIFGYTGCCTRSAFMTRSDLPPSGTLIKGSYHFVYFLSEDGKRYIFTTSIVFASWYNEPSLATLAENGPVVCPQVVQIPDELLASIPLGGNVTLRPGTTLTGLAHDPSVRYFVTRGAVLREMRVPSRIGATCPVRVDDLHLIPDAFFPNYTLGPPVTDYADYDSCREAATTLEEDLAAH
jgi:hypothetical protein